MDAERSDRRGCKASFAAISVRYRQENQRRSPFETGRIGAARGYAEASQMPRSAETLNTFCETLSTLVILQRSDTLFHRRMRGKQLAQTASDAQRLHGGRELPRLHAAQAL